MLVLVIMPMRVRVRVGMVMGMLVRLSVVVLVSRLSLSGIPDLWRVFSGQPASAIITHYSTSSEASSSSRPPRSSRLAVWHFGQAASRFSD